MNKAYFPAQQEAPEPLRITVERQVRFEEVDPLAIVWHGRYPGYFEDARVALSEKFGISYMNCYENGVLTPIKSMHLDYLRPLRFMERFTIEGILHWSDAARLNFEFILRNESGEVTTTGYTVQMMLDSAQTIMLIPPPFFRVFFDRWKAGEFR